jgi:hypothetical protein
MPSRLICVQVMFLKTSRFLTGMSFRSCRRAKALSSRQIQSIYLLQRKCPRAGLGVRRRKSERLHKRRRFSKKPKKEGARRAKTEWRWTKSFGRKRKRKKRSLKRRTMTMTITMTKKSAFRHGQRRLGRAVQRRPRQPCPSIPRTRTKVQTSVCRPPGHKSQHHGIRSMAILESTSTTRAPYSPEEWICVVGLTH